MKESVKRHEDTGRKKRRNQMMKERKREKNERTKE
jgi:hypothetical protein